MNYSRKVESYINIEKLEKVYSEQWHEADERVKDFIWYMIHKKYPNIKDDKADELYEELIHKLYSEYDIIIKAKVKRRRMRVVIIKIGLLRYAPYLIDEGRELMCFSRILKRWTYSTTYPKSFRTRKAARRFLEDWSYDIDKS